MFKDVKAYHAVRMSLWEATGDNGPLDLDSFYTNQEMGAGLFTHQVVDQNNLGGIRGDSPANIYESISCSEENIGHGPICS
eukprot:CAMPEP_0113688318 /NCGR_PEP_ID=MMETSP0038_2-20120614/16453_1 /TAXON_ID=2898 /ORGANISM="Cryptomonas paramecium" /LENGTH=80 /DNA_ID=CAMNT_0000609087 /DNA_START=17 /DNA_END=259 /DNA_ORIENTATION=+ /assembly_acc=CAM_ASM_000170